MISVIKRLFDLFQQISSVLLIDLLLKSSLLIDMLIIQLMSCELCHRIIDTHMTARHGLTNLHFQKQKVSAGENSRILTDNAYRSYLYRVCLELYRV